MPAVAGIQMGGTGLERPCKMDVFCAEVRTRVCTVRARATGWTSRGMAVSGSGLARGRGEQAGEGRLVAVWAMAEMVLELGYDVGRPMSSPPWANAPADSSPSGFVSGGICILGNLLVDLVLPGLQSLPDWGVEVAGSRRRLVPAGQAAQMARMLGQLGVDTSVLSAVGADEEGRLVLEALEAAGADVSSIAMSELAATGLTVALVREDGERAFISDFAVLAEVDEDFVAERWGAIERCGTLVIAGLFNLPGLTLAGAGRILERARAEARATVLDTGWDIGGWTPETVADIRRLLPMVDIFLPNAVESEALTGMSDPYEAAEALAADGARVVVVKRGGDGCVASAEGRTWAVKGTAVDVVDTVGAGDVFDAGLLFALGAEANLMNAMRFANAAAAIYVSRAENRFPALEGIVRSMAAATAGVEVEAE
jgi:ribokinase